MVFGVLLAVGLFIVLPYIATNLLVGRLQDQPFKWNLVDGVLRLLVLFGYIWLISRMKDVKRLFAYHGAEHKTIHAYEHGVPSSPKRCSSSAPRTSAAARRSCSWSWSSR